METVIIVGMGVVLAMGSMVRDILAYQRFLQQLRAVPSHWHVTPDGANSWALRTTDGVCPLIAVFNHQRGRGRLDRRANVKAIAVGMKLRLPAWMAGQIASAADDDDGSLLGWRIRSDLFAATVNRPAPQVPTPAPDPMDRALANLIAEGVSAEPAGKELAAV